MTDAIAKLTTTILLAAVIAAPVAAKEPRVKGGKLEFRLCDVSGDTVSSADPRFRSKVVFVTIWGTWCPPCISEIPTFNKLQKRYADDGLVIVGIAFERVEDSAKRRRHLARFIDEHDIDYLILDGGALSEFETALPMMDDVKGFPIEIFIDRTGRVVESRNGYGYKRRWARKLAKELSTLLSAKPAASD
jgi:thiol-disulfide isomerase/thioredoxin